MQVSMGDIALLVSTLDSSPVNTMDVRKLLTKVTQNFVNHCIVAKTCSAQSFVIPSTHPNTHTHMHTNMHTHVHTHTHTCTHTHAHTRAHCIVISIPHAHTRAHCIVISIPHAHTHFIICMYAHTVVCLGTPCLRALCYHDPLWQCHWRPLLCLHQVRPLTRVPMHYASSPLLH